MKDMAARLFSVRTADCILSVVNRKVTPSTRSSVGHMQNRSASAELCVCNRHSIGAGMRKGTAFFKFRTAVSAAAAIARREAAGDSVTPLPWP
ncbi:hypothetical protein D9M70_593630 [compost metagenome]